MDTLKVACMRVELLVEHKRAALLVAFALRVANIIRVVVVLLFVV